MRASFYECDVTPPLGCFMWGHYADVRAADVQDRLYVKALVTEDDNKNIAAIVCIDSCSIPPEMHDIVTKRITEYTGIPANNVCLTSNHTHWGAPISDSAEIRCFADSAYKDVFYRLTADAVTLAYKRLDDASAKFGLSEVHGISFCRDYVYADKTITFGRSDEKQLKMLSEIDPSLSVMMFERDGKPFGAVVNFACHQCCCGGINGYSGDYSSELSRQLKAIYGQDFVSLFVAGTCGDLTHVNNDKTVKAPAGWYKEMGRRLAEKAVEAINNSEVVTGAVECVKETITVGKRQATPEVVKQRLEQYMKDGGSLMRVRNLIHYEATNTDTTYDLTIQTFRIGKVCFYALPGEVYVYFGFKLKKNSKFKYNILMENCNCYCGYIPSPEAFGENCDLYETSLCHHSCLVPEAGDIITDRLLEIAGKFDI